MHAQVPREVKGEEKEDHQEHKLKTLYKQTSQDKTLGSSGTPAQRISKSTSVHNMLSKQDG